MPITVRIKASLLVKNISKSLVLKEEGREDGKAEKMNRQSNEVESKGKIDNAVMSQPKFIGIVKLETSSYGTCGGLKENGYLQVAVKVA